MKKCKKGTAPYGQNCENWKNGLKKVTFFKVVFEKLILKKIAVFQKKAKNDLKTAFYNFL